MLSKDGKILYNLKTVACVAWDKEKREVQKETVKHLETQIKPGYGVRENRRLYEKVNEFEREKLIGK